MDLLTTAQAARLACCEPHVIYAWRSRGLLTPVARDDHGRPLYDQVAVLQIEKDTRVNTTRRGGRTRKIVLPMSE